MDVLTVERGRVQIPDAVRKALGMADYAQVRLEIQDDRLVLIPLNEAHPANSPPTSQVDMTDESTNAQLGLRRKDGILIIEAESIEGNLDILDDIREERIQGLMGL
jgi:bifunctional DNA-binding transcriptional regulator/antitoxin component of YhaV-PrlF toxin-antitoxin module